MSKSFVMDDEHWITINGNHVLINGEGEVQSGMGGALKGVKLSKATSSMKGGKFSKPKEEYKKAKSEIREASKKADELRKKSFDRRKADIDKIDKQEEEVEKKYENIWTYGHSYGRLKHLNPEKYAKLMERVKKKGKALEKERKAERDKLDNARQQVHEREDGRLESIRSTAEKNYETASNKMVKAYQKNREAKNALSSARSKLKSAREANAYMKQRGTKVSKATPDMVGGRFYHPKNESEVLKDIAKSAEKKYLRSGDKRYERGAEFTRKEQKIAERKASAAKSTLEKARPKIAERRQAIRKYNEREDEKLAKAMGLGKYRKPYYETDAFKSGKKDDYI